MAENDHKVAVIKSAESSYPQDPPYHPEIAYPEYTFSSRSDTPNQVYHAVRCALQQLQLDTSRIDTATWNPLAKLIQPGMVVFLKPNMIAHKHALNDDWNYVMTHGSVIRAVIDYVFIALHGEGRIVIGDAPQTDSHFDRILQRMGLEDIQSFYQSEKNFEIEILDLRDEHWIEKDGIYVETVKLPGDPSGSVAVDLAEHSLFAEFDGQGKSVLWCLLRYR